jgi:hypothetical protein
MAHFVQIGIFSRVDETHVSLERKPYVLQAGASSTLFPYENRVIFSKEYIQQIRCSKAEMGSVSSK